MSREQAIEVMAQADAWFDENDTWDDEAREWDELEPELQELYRNGIRAALKAAESAGYVVVPTSQLEEIARKLEESAAPFDSACSGVRALIPGQADEVQG